MITFQVETWEQYYPDCLHLLDEDRIVFGNRVMKIKPDADKYKALEKNGVLQIVTARESGVMIGFQITHIATHIQHADDLCGFQDSIYIAKSKRNSKIFLHLINQTINLLKTKGVQWFFYTRRNDAKCPASLSNMGFVSGDISYLKWIGN